MQFAKIISGDETISELRTPNIFTHKKKLIKLGRDDALMADGCSLKREAASWPPSDNSFVSFDTNPAFNSDFCSIDQNIAFYCFS